MDTLTEQTGRVAKTRKTPEYEMCLDELLGAVESEEEYNLLRQLVHRAGAGWICATNNCRGINVHSDGRCVGCDKMRPKLRDVPVLEDMTRLSIDYQRQERQNARKLSEMET
jgi:flavoprotein